MQLPVAAIRQQCAGAFDLIVHTERLRDGTRKIISITEVGQMVARILLTIASGLPSALLSKVARRTDSQPC